MTELKSTTALTKKLRRILLHQLFLAGIVTTTAAVVAAWVVLSLLAGVMILPVWLKITLLSATGTIALYFFVSFAVARLFYGSAEGVARSLATPPSWWPGQKNRPSSRPPWSISTMS